MNFNEIMMQQPTYLPIINNLNTCKKILVNEIDQLEEKYWFFDNYRKVNMSLLFSGGGVYKNKKEIQANKCKKMIWTEGAKSTPFLKNFIEKKIFPLLDGYGRVTILKTRPGQRLNEHFDCAPNEQNDFMPKLRLVISGDNGALYFKNNNQKKIFISNNFDFYLIDGSRAHGMRNKTHQNRYTLCIGAPWKGQFTLSGKELIENSFNNNRSHILSRTNFTKLNQKIHYQGYQ